MVVAAFLLVLVLAEWPSVAGALLPQGALSGIKITSCLSRASLVCFLDLSVFCNS